MPTNRIKELKRKRRKQIERKKDQMPYGILILLLVIIVYIVFLNFNTRYSIFWILGLLIGITLQRSRFCFTASFRDPVLVGSTSLIKAVIIAFIISTLGFVIIQYTSIGNTGNFDIINVPGQIKPVGLHTVIGAIMFGIGMVIAGGCASGTLMRIGEGFQLQIIVLVGFVVGTLLGAGQFKFWDKVIIQKSPTIYLPQYLGFPWAIIIQLSVLIVLYFLADWYDKNNNIMSL